MTQTDTPYAVITGPLNDLSVIHKSLWMTDTQRQWLTDMAEKHKTSKSNVMRAVLGHFMTFGTLELVNHKKGRSLQKVRITRAQQAWLSKTAHDSGVTIQDILSRIIDEYVVKFGGKQ